MSILFTRRCMLALVGSSVACSCSAFAQWPGQVGTRSSTQVGNRSISAIEGCCLRAGELEVFGEAKFAELSTVFDIAADSMTPAMRQSFGRALVDISAAFSVRPGFSFIDDGARPNAYAAPEVRVPGTWGTVLFGRTLFQRQMERFGDFGVSVIAICAHEFGHILQFSSNAIDRMMEGARTVKLVELQADYLAGFYLGRLKRENTSINLQGAGKTFSELGDVQFNSRDHHGTSDERVSAAEAGFRSGFNRGRIPAQQLVNDSAEFILTNFRKI